MTTLWLCATPNCGYAFTSQLSQNVILSRYPSDSSHGATGGGGTVSNKSTGSCPGCGVSLIGAIPQN